MQWNPYTDQKIRGFNHILTTLFPEQTKTLPRILIWGLIFLIDLCVITFGAFHLGLLNEDTMSSGWLRWLMLPAIIGVFWLQGWIWGAVTRLVGKIMA